jgi:hypothetical protein
MTCRDTSSTETDVRERDALGRTVLITPLSVLQVQYIKERREREIGPGCLPSVQGMYGDPFTCEEISYLVR